MCANCDLFGADTEIECNRKKYVVSTTRFASIGRQMKSQFAPKKKLNGMLLICILCVCVSLARWTPQNSWKSNVEILHAKMRLNKCNGWSLNAKEEKEPHFVHVSPPSDAKQIVIYFNTLAPEWVELGTQIRWTIFKITAKRRNFRRTSRLDSTRNGIRRAFNIYCHVEMP